MASLRSFPDNGSECLLFADLRPVYPENYRNISKVRQAKSDPLRHSNQLSQPFRPDLVSYDVGSFDRHEREH